MEAIVKTEFGLSYKVKTLFKPFSSWPISEFFCGERAKKRFISRQRSITFRVLWMPNNGLKLWYKLQFVHVVK